MYIESKADGLNGSARIGRVTFSKTRLSIYYKGRTFFRVQGFKTNYREVETGNELHRSFGPQKARALRMTRCWKVIGWIPDRQRRAALDGRPKAAVPT